MFSSFPHLWVGKDCVFLHIAHMVFHNLLGKLLDFTEDFGDNPKIRRFFFPQDVENYVCNSSSFPQFPLNIF